MFTPFWLAATLGWLAFSYVVISFVEFLAHGVFMHKPTWLSKRFGLFEQVLHLHRTFHHGECFPGRHFDEHEGDCLEKNIRFDFLQGQVMSCWVWIPLFLAAQHYGLSSTAGAFCALGGVTMMASVFVHHCIWNLVHRQMHSQPAKRASWFKNSRVCLWLARYHFMHHAYPKVNFCVVCPGADWIMGTYKAPSAKDVEEMQKHGFI